VTPDETAERAALLAKSQRYEEALRRIAAADVRPDLPDAEWRACGLAELLPSIAREALAVAQEDTR
jgi:hypothetical protein